MARRGFVVVIGRVEGLPLVMIVAVLGHDGGRYAVDMRPNSRGQKCSGSGGREEAERRLCQADDDLSSGKPPAE